VGDGPERPHIERICRESTVNNDIRFLGKQEQMEDILAVSDIFLLPSEYESFGLAALEAMAAAVPVISTNAGGLPEINVNNYCGFLSEVGDVDDMCKNTLYILSDEVKLKEFKQNALQQAIKFDINNIVPEYEALYKTFIA
jgi:glycosyltransferase involved in cell wall biosynthesis